MVKMTWQTIEARVLQTYIRVSILKSKCARVFAMKGRVFLCTVRKALAFKMQASVLG